MPNFEHGSVDKRSKMIVSCVTQDKMARIEVLTTEMRISISELVNRALDLYFDAYDESEHKE